MPGSVLLIDLTISNCNSVYMRSFSENPTKTTASSQKNVITKNPENYFNKKVSFSV